MKKTTLLFALLILGISAILPSCTKVNGKGPVVSEIREVGNFTKIDFGTTGRLYYKTGSEHRVEIRAQRNIQDVIEAYVSNGELNLKIRNNTVIHSYETIEVYIESPAINGFKVNGSGDIYASDPIETNQFYTDINGSGKIDIRELVTPQMEADVNGSGDILIRGGSIGNANLDISGSGDINMIGCETTEMKTETSGSGDMRVWVTDKLNARISGSGSVKYKGNPQVTVKVSGSGKVEPY